MRRREFIALLGGAAACPVSARAQQRTMPVVGFIHAGSPATSIPHLSAFRHGLNELGYVEGHNVTIAYRWAEGRQDRYSELVTDLISLKVDVIATGANTLASRVAKAATSTIPIVFGVGDDPVKLGLVTSLAKPGGNATGINFFIAELTAKRLGLLHEMMPDASRLAVLVNPDNVTTTDSTVKDVQTAAAAFGLQIEIFHAGTVHKIDAAFANFARERIDAVFVGPDPFFNSRRVQLAIAAARYAMPAMYSQRDYVEAGGLMSYGADVADAYRHVGVYTARILRGEKPADLPVVQSTKLELVINAQTARTLALSVPSTLLARADEVIE